MVGEFQGTSTWVDGSPGPLLPLNGFMDLMIREDWLDEDDVAAWEDWEGDVDVCEGRGEDDVSSLGGRVRGADFGRPTLSPCKGYH